MFEVIREWTGEGVVALRVSGKLVHEDYEQLVPRLEEAIREHGALRCLIEVTGIKGVTPRAAWDELRFDLEHAKDVMRCAVVGNRDWERWMTIASRAIFRRAEVRYFERGDLDDAIAWVR